MNLLIALLALAPAVNGGLSERTMDTALVKVPIHRRIGAVVNTPFTRGNDSRNGLRVSLLLRVRAVLLTVLASTLAYEMFSSIKKILFLIFFFSPKNVERVITLRCQEEEVL